MATSPAASCMTRHPSPRMPSTRISTLRAQAPPSAALSTADSPLTIENQAWQLKAPNRYSWGLSSIKSEYTDAVMANIRYYKTGDEEKDPVAVDELSYHQGDYALMGLPEASYTIIYETKDPNTGAHMNSWKFENVVIKQGRDKEEATTALSSVNATKIDE